MSVELIRRALPARPSVEYLRKLAKDYLAEQRAGQPGMQLAEAQLYVARQHGFSSWRAMHEHIERLYADANHPSEVNFFTYPTAAERYAAGRPYFHSLVIERVRDACRISAKVERALDVGCGTGQSTIALLDLAELVIGTDVSAEMIRQAPAHPRVRYHCVPAEALPLDLGKFELLTVGVAFHWFKYAQFMPLAHELLRPSGWLVIFNDFFRARMHGNPAFSQWNANVYVKEFPTPPRNYSAMSSDDARRFGFIEQAPITFDHDVEFTSQELVAYLLTQTNTIAAIERGGRSIDEVARQLLNGVKPLFTSDRERFAFRCEIRIYRQVPGA